LTYQLYPRIVFPYHPENLSKSKIVAKEMARSLRVEYPGAYYHDA